MKRPAVLIVALVAGALLVAGAGASAHTLSLVRELGTQTTKSFNDEASGARTESPEPTESPEATPTAEPTEKPEPTEAAEPPENEPADNDANEQEHQGSHESGGGDHHSGGGDDHSGGGDR